MTNFIVQQPFILHLFFVMQIDIAATLALLFNVPIPNNNIGVVIPHALNFMTGCLSLTLSLLAHEDYWRCTDLFSH